MKDARGRKLNMLSGPVWNQLLMFALPLAAAGILQQLFNAADIAVVGRFVGKNAMAAVGGNSSVISLLVNLFVGISIGTNVVIAHLTGSGNEGMVQKAVHTSIVVAVAGGVALAVIGEISAPLLLRILSVPEEVLPLSVLYLRIYLLGMPVILLYNFESAILRSQGDTRTPMLVLTFSGVVNVALNLVFVLLFRMTVDGVALATVISNLISASVLFVLLMRNSRPIGIRIHALRVDPLSLKQILSIGVPSGIQGMMFSISNICVQAAINSLGATIMAASSAAYNLEVFSYYIVSSFGQACTTFVGQNYGAGNLKRCDRVLGVSLGMDFLLTAFLCGLILLMGHLLLSIFNTDPEVIENGYTRLIFLFSGYPFSIMIEVISGYLRGFGKSFAPALMSLLGVCGVRILWVYTVFPMRSQFSTLMMVYPLSLLLTALAVICATLRFHKKQFSAISSNET